MLNDRKSQKICQKFRILYFTTLLTILVETHLRRKYFEQQIWCVLSEEMSFKTLLPCGSMLAKTNKQKKKKNAKNPKFEFSQFFEQLW